jgi:hypothetical protein
MNKIDFICIGPGKSGTTYIYNVLKNHPEVGLSSSKETLFFEKYYNKGIEWYHNFFDFSQNRKILGEISNTYIFDNKVPQLIYDYNPKIKLITTLRNPIDRTFSHYLYMIKVGEEKGSFKEVLNRRPDLIKRGSYSELIAEYDKYFQRENIKVMLFEDLQEKPFEYTNSLFDFLDINNELKKEIIEKKVLEAAKPRSYYLSKVVSTLSRIARDLGLARLVTKLKFNKTVTSLIYHEFKKGDKPELSPEERHKLMKLFSKDVEKLSKRLGKDMLHYWKFEENAS